MSAENDQTNSPFYSMNHLWNMWYNSTTVFEEAIRGLVQLPSTFQPFNLQPSYGVERIKELMSEASELHAKLSIALSNYQAGLLTNTLTPLPEDNGKDEVQVVVSDK